MVLVVGLVVRCWVVVGCWAAGLGVVACCLFFVGTAGCVVVGSSGCLEGVFSAVEDYFGRSKAALETILCCLGGALGLTWGDLWPSWAALGLLLAVLGPLLGPSWPLLGRSWLAFFCRSWSALGPLLAAFGLILGIL